MEIRVVVASEICFYREALSSALRAEPGLEVTGSFRCADLLAGVRTQRPDVVLLHLVPPAGPDLARAVRATHPGAAVVVLAASESEDVVLAWAASGVSGYVPKDGSVSQVVETVRVVARGEAACSPLIAATLLRRVRELTTAPSPPERALTTRELDVVQLITAGLSNKEIANSLHIALPTVKNHVHNILDKLQVGSRVDIPHVLRARV